MLLALACLAWVGFVALVIVSIRRQFKQIEAGIDLLAQVPLAAYEDAPVPDYVPEEWS